ncbi:MAG TPA: arsenic transporter [Chthoniobacterales bacterium]|nr:arsenic transporter [Chthoniobacterales bacterium]
MGFHNAAVWLISLTSIALVLLRPKRLAEAWWASAGACLLVLSRLISVRAAIDAVRKGLDVYFFLVGMMIMSELARREGVFDWVAGHAVRASRGSQSRLFLLIYIVGTVVTVFLSNDATAVVLTPAVLAAVRAAGAEPLPYLLICAFIANAASFVLPISNPANLVVYGAGMPPLGIWLLTFGVPSVASIIVTFLVLRWLLDKHLLSETKTDVDGQPLSAAGRLTLYGIAFLALVLMTASAFNVDLGAPAFAAGTIIAAAVSFRDYATPLDLAKEISWSVLPLVAGLFVIVEAISSAGALGVATHILVVMSHWPTVQAITASSFGVAFLSNLMNNLPSGLISGAAVKAAGTVGPLRDSVLIGVDLGPNLSVTGSLATILWLLAIRREGLHVSFWRFLQFGALVMPPALALSVLSLLLGSSK